MAVAKTLNSKQQTEKKRKDKNILKINVILQHHGRT